MASRQGSSAKAAAADFDPVHEWHDGDESHLLRLNLPGFKKEDFLVRVYPGGRLIILAQRPADGGEGDMQLHKEFQLPSTSNLVGITGRYDGSVLSLTVPKLPPGDVPPPQAKEEADDDVADKITDQKSKVGLEAERRIEAAKARLPGRQRDEEKNEQTGRKSKKPPATKVEERKEEQPKAEATARPSEKAAKREDDQDEKAKAEEHQAKVKREAERRIDAARARLAAERSTEKGCWKERAAEEGFKWAEAIGKNKEVIAATAVAAFTLGVFVSHRLFRRN